LPGPQVAIISYSPHHVLNDWVYNAAEIDNSKVIWARQMDPASDRELLNYYKDRQAWLVEPDSNPPRISTAQAPGSKRSSLTKRRRLFYSREHFTQRRL